MSESPVCYADVPGFPGYRVGDDGSVWTCRRRGWSAENAATIPLQRRKSPSLIWMQAGGEA